MIETERTKYALRIANQAHKEQVDDRGYPFVAHLVHIAKSMETEDTCVAALMHDILSTPITLHELRSHFTSNQIIAIELLQYTPLSTTFTEYINCIKNNDIARKVEIAFLSYELHVLKNSKQFAKQAKYKAALEILKGGKN